ncbi:MAG: right-handed parallel beta-helix repeat-containing protein [Planctomycetes bacterium]|nr:right-handed parallel beta-helix repeat-containing protein [Planctomycetota bacterium]
MRQKAAGHAMRWAAAVLTAAVCFAASGYTAVFAATLWVDAAKGNDQNDGSAEKPWATISHAAETAQPGDMVMIRGGIYREQLRPTRSGTDDKPIVLKAADAENPPILDGGMEVRGWEKFRDNIWVAAIDFEPSAAFQDDRKLLPALWPSQVDPYDPYDLEHMILVTRKSEKATEEIIDPEHLKQPAGTFDGATVLLYSGRNNACQYTPTTGHDAEQGILRVTPNKWWPIGENAESGKSRERYAVGHCLFALNDPGEWFADAEAGKMYLIPYDGKDPNTVTITVTKLAHALNLRGQDLENVVFDGLTIRYYHNPGESWQQRAMIAVSNGKHRNLTFRNLTIYNNHHGANCEIDGEGIVFEGNHVYHNESGNAIAVGRGKHIRFLNNHIHHNVGDGLWLGTGDNKNLYTVTDVEVRGNRLHHHESRKTHSDNLQFRQADNVLVVGNYFEKIHGQNMWCSVNGKLTFAYNVFVTGVAGMNNARELYVYNNVFYKSTVRWDAWHKEFPEEYRTKIFRFRNNVVVECGLGLPNCGLKGMDIAVDHNYYQVTGNWARMGWLIAESYNELRDKLPEDRRYDPKALMGSNTGEIGWHLSPSSLDGVEALFADAEKSDFHLRAGSPLIDAGADVGQTSDADGTKVPQGKGPDIGAYERSISISP